jgi:conjugative transposon TraM protein
MKINFKQPKYILPLIALPFLFLFFYVYHSSASKNKKETKQPAGINASVGDVSPAVRKKELTDKLDAYRNKYKESDGNSAVDPIPSEAEPNPAVNQKKMLDSIDRAMKTRFSTPVAPSTRENVIVEALNNMTRKQKEAPPPLAEKSKDPMDLFRQQMAYVDSMTKANDPAAKAEKQKKEALAKANTAAEKPLEVKKVTDNTNDFNTVSPEKDESFISATIDENVTGYAGSRIRLKLLEDITAGKTLIKKGAYLYALISGFSAQRATLTIKSIIAGNQILPVKLEVYDLDGLKGLYVPNSQFRDFTKDLGTNSIQGVSLDNGSSTDSRFLMSAAGKLFESSSSAIASAIRKDKARIKYNSYIYLIDDKNTNP